MFELIETFSDNEVRELLREVRKLDMMIAPANEKLSTNMQKLFDNAGGYFWSSRMSDIRSALIHSAAKRFFNGQIQVRTYH